MDRSALLPVSGAIAAVPVVVLFALGLTQWDASTALTLAIGANLVAIASKVQATRPPTALLALDALAMGVATFVGSLSEQVAWVHVAALALLCLGCGLLVAIGPVPAIIGTQAIIAFLIFGRFPATPLGALRLSGLVMLGAAVEATVVTVVRWPPAFRRQRDAVSAAFGALATSAATGGPTAAVGAALDQADGLLSTAGWLGHDDAHTLRGLIDEARRSRLELSALLGLRARLADLDAAGPARASVDAALAHLAAALRMAGDAIAADRPDPGIENEAGAVEAAADRLAPGPGGQGAAPLVSSCRHHLHALAGQMRAVARLLHERLQPGWRIEGHPTIRWRAGWDRLREGVGTLRANLTLDSPAFRHAVRLAVAVPLAEVLSRVAGLPRSYWVPLTVAVVLRPDFGSLFTKGAGRVVGTCAGVAAAGFLVAGLHPGTAAIVALLAAAAWGAYTFVQSNYAVASTCIAAVVLFLLSVSQVNTTTTAFDRVLDTVLGGAVALAAYLVWPTWSSGQARTALAKLVTALGAYLSWTLSVELGDAALSKEQLYRLTRRVRLAWSEADATVSRSLVEPAKWRIDRDLAQSLTAALRRLTRAADALHLEVASKLDVAPLASHDHAAALQDLRDALDRALAEIGASLEHNTATRPLPPLRELYQGVRAREGEPTLGGPAILVPLDEVVDTVNTVGHLLHDGRLEHVGHGG